MRCRTKPFTARWRKPACRKGFPTPTLARRREMNIESPIKGDAILFELGEDYPELREAVRKICAKYPGEYWRDLEERSAYPTEMVRDLTEGGYLAALIPQEYGGDRLPVRAAAAILEQINI